RWRSSSARHLGHPGGSLWRTANCLFVSETNRRLTATHRRDLPSIQFSAIQFSAIQFSAIQFSDCRARKLKLDRKGVWGALAGLGTRRVFEYEVAKERSRSLKIMCGRITQKSNPNRLGLGLVTVNLVEPLHSLPPKYNGAPGQEHWVIRQQPKTGDRTLDRLWWGLIPYWCKDATGGRKPINAKAETVASLPSFRDAYRRRRCMLPVDSFFEWKAIKGARAK